MPFLKFWNKIESLGLPFVSFNTYTHYHNPVPPLQVIMIHFKIFWSDTLILAFSWLFAGDAGKLIAIYEWPRGVTFVWTGEECQSDIEFYCSGVSGNFSAGSAKTHQRTSSFHKLPLNDTLICDGIYQCLLRSKRRRFVQGRTRKHFLAPTKPIRTPPGSEWSLIFFSFPNNNFCTWCHMPIHQVNVKHFLREFDF